MDHCKNPGIMYIQNPLWVCEGEEGGSFGGRELARHKSLGQCNEMNEIVLNSMSKKSQDMHQGGVKRNLLPRLIE